MVYNLFDLCGRDKEHRQAGNRFSGFDIGLVLPLVSELIKPWYYIIDQFNNQYWLLTSALSFCRCGDKVSSGVLYYIKH